MDLFPEMSENVGWEEDITIGIRLLMLRIIGESSHTKNKGKDYIIAKSEVNIPDDKLLNLLEPEQVVMFSKWRDSFANTVPESNVTVEKVLKHAENIMGAAFPYVAIKAEFKNCFNYKEYQDRVCPTLYGKAYLDLRPPVQVCIRNKSVIGPDNFKVIFPIEYAGSEAYTF